MHNDNVLYNIKGIEGKILLFTLSYLIQFLWILEILSIENCAVIIIQIRIAKPISKASINKIVPNIDYDGRDIIYFFC